MESDAHIVVLFESVSHAVRAEKLIKGAGISCKLIPVPRHLSSDCGICLRFPAHCKEKVDAILKDKIHGYSLASL